MPRIKLEGLPEEFILIKDTRAEKYALILVNGNVLRQTAIGHWDYEPSLDECLLQIKALKELEE